MTGKKVIDFNMTFAHCCADNRAPRSFTRCVACPKKITPQVMETNKRRGKETLKHLSLAKINKPRYSLPTL